MSELERLRRENERLKRDAKAILTQLPRLRLLVEYATDAMFLVSEDGTILDANRAATELCAVPRDGLHGTHLDGIEARWVLDDATSGTIRAADGSTVPVDVTVAPCRDPSGPAFVVSARDATERRKLYARTMQADRMMAVGNLAAGVGHEINTPLAYLIANIQFVAEQLDRKEHPLLVEALEEALRGGRQVQQITRDLHTMSQTDGDEALVDVHRVVRSAVGFAGNEIRHRARLVWDIEDVGPVQMSETLLTQAVLNLVINAAQAIDTGAADRNRITVRIQPVADTVVIEVEDTGRGVPDDAMEAVFEPFYSTRPPEQGTGLGLSIARESVQSAGGTLSVRSRPGQTVFRIELPVAEQDEETADVPAPFERPEPQAGTARLLVIDDEPAVGRMLQRILRMYDVTHLTGGGEALRHLADGQAYDVVLCDVMMPNMTGPQFVEQLAGRHPEYPRRVIFMTGGVFGETDHRTLKRWPTVEKPFDRQKLLHSIEQILIS